MDDLSAELARLKEALENERQRADAAEQRTDRYQQRAETAEQQLRPTTLVEYIQAYHKLVYARLAVESDKSMSTMGTITNPHNKKCPKRLEPWADFFDAQQDVFRDLFSAFPEDERAFESLEVVRGMGNRVADKRIADERSLEYFQHLGIEDPVRIIIRGLANNDEASAAFDIGPGDGVRFENHVYALGENAEQEEQVDAPPPPPQARLPAPPRTPLPLQRMPPPPPPAAAAKAEQRNPAIRPDQICVFKARHPDGDDDDDGDDGDGHDHDGRPARQRSRRMAYIVEYKAPHKLTLPHLRTGLRRMDIYRDVVNRPTIPVADAEAADKGDYSTAWMVFKYHADRLAAAAITQTFHYMIEAGLEYSFLVTGEAIVFLKIDWEDPTTLYYHLAEPGPEADEHLDDDRLVYCTAVSQVLAFTLMAFRSDIQPQDSRNAAGKSLNVWAEDYEYMLSNMPKSGRKPPPTSPAYMPTTYKHVERSPFPLRFKRPTRPKLGSGDDHESGGRKNPTPSPSTSDDDDSGGGGGGSNNRRASGLSDPQTPTPAATNRGESGRQGGRRGRGKKDKQNAQDDLHPRQQHASTSSASRVRYCTQKCLLGLVAGKQLDEKCPNVSLHRRKKKHRGNRHPVSHATWLCMLRQQLKRTLDSGIRPLGKEGARGVLFQVTLLDYGYTFVAKGTVPVYVAHLEHEAVVYGRLERLQGVCVPVFLGAISLADLGRTYYYVPRVHIVHLMLLSWGGIGCHRAVAAKKKHWAISTPRAGAGAGAGAGGADKDEQDASRNLFAEWRKGLEQTVRELHANGVVHRDVRWPNILWNVETGRFMLVDFERSLLVSIPPPPPPPLPRPSPSRPALASIVPNKRSLSEAQGKPSTTRLGMATARTTVTAAANPMADPRFDAMAAEDISMAAGFSFWT